MKNEKSSSKLPWLVVGIMAMVLLWLVYERVRLSSENDEYRTELETIQSDKEKVKTELADMLVEYENMQTSNAQINEELKKEREKIAQLMEEIQNVKSNNSVAIARYKKEIKTLREVMKSFVRQIDSLNTQNQELKAQVNQVDKKYRETLSQKNQLTTRSDSLAKQVSAAEVLVAEGIVVTPLNSRGNDTSRASKAKKVQVDFVIRDNPVARAGERKVYVCVVRLDGMTEEVLSNSIESGVTELYNPSGELVSAGYSAAKSLMYNGEKTSGTVFFEFGSEPAKGNYRIEIYIGKKLAGTKSLTLK